MKITAFCTLAALAVCLSAPPVSAGDPAPVELIMFDQDHCEWCERWEEEIGVVYAKTPEGKAAPLRRIDIHDDRPEPLTAIKGVAFTPTFVLIENGKELGRIAGYPGEDFFWPMLAQLLEKREEATD